MASTDELSRTSRALSRREFVGGAVSSAVGLYGWRTPARASGRRPPRPRTVAVFGGGIGGLTAAQELAERGFRVTVYERHALGGKANSTSAPRTQTAGRRPLPSMDARFFPGFFRNLPETMRRIPQAPNPHGTYDNRVSATQTYFARSGGREGLVLPSALPDLSHFTIEQLRGMLVELLSGRLAPQEAEYFVQRLLVFFTSCDARRLGQWERMSWYDFTAAGRLSNEYRLALVEILPHFLLAAKAREASAWTVGSGWEQIVFAVLGRGSSGSFDQVLNAPTDEALFVPWVRHLRRLGVRFRMRTAVTGLELRGGRIVGASVRGPRGLEDVAADWFVVALPVERARRLWTRAILAADPRLAAMEALETRWMDSVQFFLKQRVPIAHGHVVHVDSAWALGSISQAQFWTARDFARDYGDGAVRDCLSAVIGDFGCPGTRYGKPARALRPAQIARDAWEQMKAHVDDTGRATLTDDMLHSWFFRPARGNRALRPEDEQPLLISTPGSWGNRPDAVTAIPNLFLAADYVRVNINTASMEGANEAGRRAANALLEAARSTASQAQVYALYQPPELQPLRAIDEELYRRGEPNALDTPPPPSERDGPPLAASGRPLPARLGPAARP